MQGGELLVRERNGDTKLLPKALRVAHRGKHALEPISVVLPDGENQLMGQRLVLGGPLVCVEVLGGEELRLQQDMIVFSIQVRS